MEREGRDIIECGEMSRRRSGEQTDECRAVLGPDPALMSSSFDLAKPIYTYTSRRPMLVLFIVYVASRSIYQGSAWPLYSGVSKAMDKQLGTRVLGALHSAKSS